MNKEEFRNYIIEEFPTVFTTHFAVEMLENILNYAEGMSEIEQYNFLCSMIPQMSEQEIRKVNY